MGSTFSTTIRIPQNKHGYTNPLRTKGNLNLLPTRSTTHIGYLPRWRPRTNSRLEDEALLNTARRGVARVRYLVSASGANNRSRFLNFQ